MIVNNTLSFPKLSQQAEGFLLVFKRLIGQ